MNNNQYNMVWAFYLPDTDPPEIQYLSDEFNNEINRRILTNTDPFSFEYDLGLELEYFGPSTITYDSGEASFILHSEKRLFGFINGKKKYKLFQYQVPNQVPNQDQRLDPLQKPITKLESTHKLKHIPTKVPSDPNELIKIAECPICLINIKNIVSIPCGHTMCSDCYSILKHKVCFVCKEQINNTQTIYLKKYLKYKNKYNKLRNDV